MNLPIYVFSHNYLINDWNKILNNQLKIIKDNGFYEVLTSIKLFAYGDNKNFKLLEDIIAKYDNSNKIQIIRINNNLYEYPTLQALHEFSEKQEAYILYFHLKGVWSTANNNLNIQAIESWRECLEYFNIEKWKDCVDKLDEGYDVVGALYNYNPTDPLFSGNFWWTKTEYLRKLPKLVFDPFRYPNEDRITWVRVECEKWINKIPNNFFNFYIPKDYGFYYVPLNPKDYKFSEKINHIYSSIEGWFDFESIYKEMVENASYNAHFVEVGAWLGKSTSFMAVEIANSEKNIKFDVVDTWEGSNEQSHKDYIRQLSTSLYDKFLANVSPVINYINPIVGYSDVIADNYEDGTLDFVFLDASHDYDSLKTDIIKWYPKVKDNGIIAGHDYNLNCFPGVVTAVDEYFNGKENVKIVWNETGSWMVEKNSHLKSKKIKYSFITPTYNRHDSLKVTIDSVKNQNYGNWEMLICSDGEDSIVENIISDYNDDRIQYFFTSRTNNTRTTQRNLMLEKVMGDYIIFLDDDNYIYPELLEIVNNNIQNVDLLIYRIDYGEPYFTVFPPENKIDPTKINTLNFVRNNPEVQVIHNIELKDDQIYFESLKDFKNVIITIKSLKGEVIYFKDKSDYYKNCFYWFIPDNKSYLTGFIFELYQEDELISTYKYVIEKKGIVENENDFSEKYINITLNKNNGSINSNLYFVGNNNLNDFPCWVTCENKDICFYPTKDFQNCTILIKNLKNEVIFHKSSDNYHINNVYWFVPDNDSYLSGFIFELYQEGELKIKLTHKYPFIDKKIVIFYHCYLTNNWKSIVQNQIFLMKRYGLYEKCSKIFAFVFSENQESYEEFKNLIAKEDLLNKWSITIMEKNNYEYDTLKSIKNYCENNDAYICYFHTKGVVSEKKEENVGIPFWRKYLNYFTINKWKENIEKLKYNDIVCVDFDFSLMHYQMIIGGNFFWTTSKYIKNLLEPIYMENRYLAEAWITSLNNITVYENFHIDFNLYMEILNPQVYRSDFDNLKIEEEYERKQQIIYE